jgi:ZIP family zinc transporter
LEFRLHHRGPGEKDELMMDTHNILFAFGLTLLAGLSTGVGSILAFFTKHTNKKFLSIALGFSAGVMIYVSFVELFFDAKKTLAAGIGEAKGVCVATAAFFCGILIIAVIDRLVPTVENPHEIHTVEEISESPDAICKPGLLRVGMMTAVALAIHNLPEGIATFTSALVDPAVGISIAIAIAIHNIPEGIAVSVPVYYATCSRGKAFAYSFLSGIAEPIGAVFGFVFLLMFQGDMVFGVMSAAVAGIMVFISLDELLPSAQRYGEPHLAIYGLIGGMMVMAFSLIQLM